MDPRLAWYRRQMTRVRVRVQVRAPDCLSVPVLAQSPDTEGELKMSDLQATRVVEVC